LPHGGLAHGHRLRHRHLAVRGDPADEVAVIAIEQMQIPFCVDHA